MTNTMGPMPTSQYGATNLDQSSSSYAGSTYSGQAHSGQAHSGQAHSGQAHSGQAYPGQAYPGQGYVSSYPAHPANGGPSLVAPASYAESTNPGRTLGIVGLILSPFAGLIGFIVSMVALRRSKRAGFANVPAVIGMVVGGLATVGVLVAIVVGGIAIGGVVDTCRDLGPGQHVVNGVTYTCG